MHSKTNRQNHDFQIAYFLAGSCHTPDGAYALLSDLRDDRADALKNYDAARLRQEAKRVRAQRRIDSDDEAEQLEGRADLAELEAFADTTAKNVAAARAELAFIEQCIERLQPLRKFAHLPDPEAHEAMQRDEWRAELIHRAENYLVAHGSIPADQLDTMRMHPDFHAAILPELGRLQAVISEVNGRAKLLAQTNGKTFDLPKLLENK